jgi:uncharacterized membrane protein
MLNGYLWLKFVHVLAASLWVGGVVMLSVGPRRQGGDYEAPDPQTPIYRHPPGGMLIPASMITTVVAGIALGHQSGGMAPWALWGLVVAVVSAVVALAFVRRYDRELMAYEATGQTEAQRAALLRRRIRRLGLLNVVLLLSAVWAMVYKPTV